MLAAIEYIDVVVAVDADGTDLVERPSLRQFPPAFLDPIPVFPGSQYDRHIHPP